MRSRKIKKLFEPIRVGRVDLKNRLVVLGMATGLGNDYAVTDKLIDFYRQMARGGAGLIVIGSVIPSDFSSTKAVYPANRMGLGIWNDEFVPGLRELTKAAHDYGSKIACQLVLCYEWRTNKDVPLEGVGASTGSGGPWHKHVRGLTVGEIHQIIEEFGEGARRAREAGFDMIEFGAAGGYLISRFLSPSSNKRTDEYGGSFENRNRFFLEIINSCKEKAGSDYTYTCRMQTDQYMPGGTTIQDAKQLAVVLENTGIAALNTHHGWHESPKPVIPQWVKPDEFIKFAAEIKSMVRIPVCAAIRIENAFIAEKILAEGKADLVGMARALVADHELPNKSKEGRFDDIRPCIVCGRCHDNVFSGIPIACSVDATLGRESPKPTSKCQKVLVIGGGPAGLEAARVAALRGHKVTLCEKGQRLGGLMILARILNEKLEPLVDYMIREIQKLPIEVKLRTEVTPALLDVMKPDVVILAAGGKPVIPEVPGVDGNNVISGHDLANLFIMGTPIKKGILLKICSHFARCFSKPSLIRGLFSLNFPIRKKVAIIGGQFAGCEMAQALIEKGKEIVIIEESNSFGADIGATTKWGIISILKKAGVRMMSAARIKEITHRGVKVNLDGTEEFIEADTVILAQGVKPNIEFHKELEEKALVLYRIGDYADFGRIREAISSGFESGCQA